MKQFCKSTFHFLGSLPFALFLIGMTAIFTIVGTVLESVTDSHRYAALMTYSNLFFVSLLWGFFINILFSALRRYPFKKKHIPFLITHWGLLMILGGVLVKSYYGKQGSMAIVEGTSSQEIFLADSYALMIESRTADGLGEKRAFLDVGKNGWQSKFVPPPFANLKVAVLDQTPHCREHFELAPGTGYLFGSQPFMMPGFTRDDKGNPIAAKVTLPGQEQNWKIAAMRCKDPLDPARRLYVASTDAIVSDVRSGAVLWQGTLEKLLSGQLLTSQGTLQAELNFGWQHSQIKATITGRKKQDSVVHFLQGSKALLATNAQPFLGSSLLAIDLITAPAIYLLQSDADLVAMAFDPYGQIIAKEMSLNALESIIAYDEGYQGYALPIELTAMSFGKNRQARELERLELLAQPLHQAEEQGDALTPPLHFLYQTCLSLNCDFTETLITFLSHWENQGGWLYPESSPLPDSLHMIFQAIDWQQVPREVYAGCAWNSAFFARLEALPMDVEGMAFKDLLKFAQWPLPFDLEIPEERLMKTITCQLFEASEVLPVTQTKGDSEANARLFSAYLRAYDLHLSSLLAGITENRPMAAIQLECPLACKHLPCEPLQKIEDNRPRMLLRFAEGKQQQTVSLSYDKFATGLKWPILGGRYLVRLQPLFVPLPYSLRLRQARQINYAGSGQPYSYESDLLIKEIASGLEVEKTISMNEVHETWDGYRFYLANIHPPDPGALKRVQIVANRDPAKYVLTYAGALIMSIGILLLFWWRPYKK